MSENEEKMKIWKEIKVNFIFVIFVLSDYAYKHIVYNTYIYQTSACEMYWRGINPIDILLWSRTKNLDQVKKKISQIKEQPKQKRV